MPFRLHLVHALVSLATVMTAVAPTAWAATPKRPRIEVPGELTVTSLTNGASIEIDGKPVGVVPLGESLVLMPGKHTIRMIKRGYTEYKETFEVMPGEPVELEIDLLPFAGMVKITTLDPGSTVKIDGKVEGVTPFDKDVPAGKKVITISRADFYDEVRELDVRAGEFYELAITLRPMKTQVVDSQAFYETWWFWTLVGVAGVGAATAVVTTQGGETVTPTAAFSLNVP